MSLAIETTRVRDVLLADGWHHVADRSFTIDAYEFVEDGGTVFRSAQSPIVCSTGAEWKEERGRWVAAPLSSILAIRFTRTKGCET